MEWGGQLPLVRFAPSSRHGAVGPLRRGLAGHPGTTFPEVRPLRPLRKRSEPDQAIEASLDFQARCCGLHLSHEDAARRQLRQAAARGANELAGLASRAAPDETTRLKHVKFDTALHNCKGWRST